MNKSDHFCILPYVPLFYSLSGNPPLSWIQNNLIYKSCNRYCNVDEDNAIWKIEFETIS